MGIAVVGTDTHMLRSHQFADILHMVHKGVDVVGQPQHSGIGEDPHHTAAICNGFQSGIVFTADKIMERPGTGVGCHNGLFGNLCRFSGTAQTGMGHVNDDPALIETFDQIFAQSTQAAVGFLGASVAHEVAAVVGQMHKADTHTAPVINKIQFLFHILQVPCQRGTVDAPDESHLAFGVDFCNIVSIVSLGDSVTEPSQHLGVGCHALEVFYMGFPLCNSDDHSIES